MASMANSMAIEITLGAHDGHNTPIEALQMDLACANIRLPTGIASIVMRRSLQASPWTLRGPAEGVYAISKGIRQQRGKNAHTDARRSASGRAPCKRHANAGAREALRGFKIKGPAGNSTSERAVASLDQSHAQPSASTKISSSFPSVSCRLSGSLGWVPPGGDWRLPSRSTLEVGGGCGFAVGGGPGSSLKSMRLPVAGCPLDESCGGLGGCDVELMPLPCALGAGLG